MEITHIAIVQLSGIVDNGATQSQAFGNEADALGWVEGIVREAHGEDETITTTANAMLNSRILDNGTRRTWPAMLRTIRTSGGPTWGMVIEVDNAI